MENMRTFVIDEGIRLHIAEEENAGNDISVFYRTKSKKENASAMAVLAKCLKFSSEKYKDKSSLEYASERCGISLWDVFTAKKGDEHILCFNFKFNHKSDISAVGQFVKEVIFYPEIRRFSFARTEKGRFAVKNDILSFCDDFRNYGKMRFAEEMARGRAFGIRNNGFFDDAGKVAGDEVYRLYSKIIRTAPCEIFYTGDCDWEFVREEIAEAFGKLRGYFVPMEENKPALKTEIKAVKEKRNITESMVFMGFVQKEDVGKENIFPLMVLNEIFGGASGILYEKVREKNALCYYVSSDIYVFKQIIVAETAVKGSDMKTAAEIIKSAFESLRNKETIEKNITSAVKRVSENILMKRDSIDNMVEFYLDNIIMGIDYSIDEFAEKIKSVSADDVLRCRENFEIDTVYFLEGVK